MTDSTALAASSADPYAEAPPAAPLAADAADACATLFAGRVAVVRPAPPPAPPTAARVLHVINGEHYSGAERVQDLLAGYLPACGYDVHFACVKPDRFPAARKFSDARMYLTPMHSRFDFGCGRRLADLLRDENYQIIHAHTPRSLMVSMQAARRAKVPLVYHVHSPAGRDSTRPIRNMINVWLERRAGHRARRLIAVSPSVRRYMIEQGFRASQVVYVPNGVPRIDVRPRRGAPASWTLGMAALFRPRKGVEVLLHALAKVRKAGGDVRLRAIGPFETPGYEASVHALAKRLGVADAIEWTGFVSDIASELACIDVLVLPSLFGEGLPMVVLEAMAAAVPVIASDVEGVPEAIGDREEGLLVKPNNAKQLAAAIETLVRGDVDYDELSRNAQDRHVQFFSAEAMAVSIADVYDAVLGRD